ncbi:hypothetical protein BGX26_003386, partial [Mortierella sp. AD094]
IALIRKRKVDESLDGISHLHKLCTGEAESLNWRAWRDRAAEGSIQPKIPAGHERCPTHRNVFPWEWAGLKDKGRDAEGTGGSVRVRVNAQYSVKWVFLSF